MFDEENKLAKLRRCISRVHLGKMHFGNQSLKSVSLQKHVTSRGLQTLCNSPETQTEWKSESGKLFSVGTCSLRVGARDALHIKVTSEKITCADFKHDGQLFEGHLLSRRLEEAGSGASF